MDEQAIARYLTGVRAMTPQELRDEQARLAGIARQWDLVPGGASQALTARRLLSRVDVDATARGRAVDPWLLTRVG